MAEVLEVEAGTLIEALQKIRAQLPRGSAVLQQEILDWGETGHARVRVQIDTAGAVLEQLRVGDVRKGDRLVEGLLLGFVEEFSERYPLTTEDDLAWMIENSYFVTDVTTQALQILIGLLVETGCRYARVWTGLLHARAFIPRNSLPALEIMLWYMYTPQALQHRDARKSAQLAFLDQVEELYAQCEPALQDQIIEALEDMALRWEGQYWYVIPHCCELLVKTGRRDVLTSVQAGILRCDEENLKWLRRGTVGDVDYYDKQRALEQIAAWEKLKKDVVDALASGT